MQQQDGAALVGVDGSSELSAAAIHTRKRRHVKAILKHARDPHSPLLYWRYVLVYCY